MSRSGCSSGLTVCTPCKVHRKAQLRLTAEHLAASVYDLPGTYTVADTSVNVNCTAATANPSIQCCMITAAGDGRKSTVDWPMASVTLRYARRRLRTELSASLSQHMLDVDSGCHGPLRCKCSEDSVRVRSVGRPTQRDRMYMHSAVFQIATLIAPSVAAAGNATVQLEAVRQQKAVRI